MSQGDGSKAVEFSGPSRVRRLLRRFLSFLASFLAAYFVLQAAAPLILRLAPSGGILTFALFSILGLALAQALSLGFELLRKKGLIPTEADDAAPKGAAPTLPKLGEIGPYEVLGFLDQGPWWTTFIARRPVSLTSFALTMPRAVQRFDRQTWRLIQREAEVLSGLKKVRGSPDFIALEKLEDGCPIFTTKPGRAIPFGEIVDSLNGAQVVGAGRALLKILTKVHATQLVHRLLNSETVTVDDFGRIQLRGFAYAQRQQERSAPAPQLASLETQSPEQLAPGAVVDHRADIYAFGALFYRALTGEPWHPVEGSPDSQQAKIRAGLLNDARREAIPFKIERRHRELDPDAIARLADLLVLCLQADPRERPSSARQILKTIESFRQGGDGLGAGYADREDELELRSVSTSQADQGYENISGKELSLASLRGLSPLEDEEADITENLSDLRAAAGLSGSGQSPAAPPPSGRRAPPPPLRPAGPALQRPAPAPKPAPPPARGAGFAPAPPAGQGPIATLFGESLESEENRGR